MPSILLVEMGGGLLNFCAGWPGTTSSNPQDYRNESLYLASGATVDCRLQLAN
jgi:hypothetical protein